MLAGVRAARAEWGQSGDADEAPVGGFRYFVKTHPVEAGAGALAAIFCLFAAIMGPANLFDALLRTRRAGRPLRDIQRGLGGGDIVDRVLDDMDDARRKD